MQGKPGENPHTWQAWSLQNLITGEIKSSIIQRRVTIKEKGEGDKCAAKSFWPLCLIDFGFNLKN